MSNGQNKAIVHRVVEEVWNQGQMATVKEVVAAEYTGHDPNFPVTIRGPEGFSQWVATARNAFPDFQISIDDMIAEGDTVAGRITMRGTHQGELPGIRPTHKQVTFSGMFVRRFANGQFVEGWDLADMMGLLQQLGVIPEPGQA